jgi:simple sugar transport system permease protein
MTQTVQNPSKSDSADVPTRATPSFFSRLLSRPELGAIVAAVVIYIFFFAVSPSFRSVNALSLVLSQSAIVGIVAVAVGLLMVGGEFDLSAGVGAFAAGLAADMLAWQYNFNMIVATLLSLVLMLAIGFLNGYLVVKTGIPSFLITLGTFFVLQGVNLGVTKVVTGSVSTQDTSDIAGYGVMHDIFASNFSIGSTSFSILIVWWALFAALGGWILTRTRLGNWILAVGGNVDSARAVGVPVNKVKIGLFMGVGLMAWFYGQNVR